MSAPPIYKNDIGELKELQEYAKRQFKIIYGKLYDEYTKMLMLPSNSLPATNFNIPIDVDYGLNITQAKTPKSINSSAKKSSKNKHTNKNINLTGNNILATEKL